MRILRLTLENWRGVDARDISLGEGVTLIEGPNEIGKSTIIEAVRMLFRELDSSKKKEVKAIQPVGQDLGSRVEAEVQAGRFHFIYAKTYNRSPQTTLEVLAPDRRQLTGREAHEAVEQLLEETVDMALWDALLVDQGEKVGLASLQNSAGLARALDEAAGNAGESVPAEEGNLFEAVRAEYEQYFTSKTGRPKFSNLEEAAADAEAALARAESALTEVEDNATLQESQAAEVRRLKTALPGLEKNLATHEAQWQLVRSLADKADTKRKQLESARTIQLDAERTHNNRVQLATEVAAHGQRLQKEKDQQAPLKQQTEALKADISGTTRVLGELKRNVDAAHQRLDLTQADRTHLENLDRLAAAVGQRDRLGGISTELKTHLANSASIKVDDDGLEQIRQAFTAVNVARATRDAAATTISVTAINRLEFKMDDDTVALGAATTTTRAVSSELEVYIPDVARVRVTPSLSVAELAEKTTAAETELTSLTSRYAVKNLEEAVAANQRRADAEQAINQLKAQEQEILQSATREEIGQLVNSLQSACDGYVSQRASDTDLPEGPAKAADQATAARSGLDAMQRELEQTQKHVDSLNTRYAELDGQLRIAEQELAGLTAALADKHTALEQARTELTDDALATQADQARKNTDELAKQLAGLEAEFHAASPETAEAMVDNSRAVLNRAKSDLASAETDLAVLADRLQQAQADGRFEAMERAERKFEECQSALSSTRQRAQAAERLWRTLTRHRDAAREAYVRPLKEAIERLGVIVFGQGFEVDIGEDWSILSRTLDGKTLPFDDLSVGAREQLGILSRLAAAQIVSTQGGVPLIIDDALGFSDPGRLETMGAAIAAAGKRCQIVILTCTPGRFTHVGNAKVVKFIAE